MLKQLNVNSQLYPYKCKDKLECKSDWISMKMSQYEHECEYEFDYESQWRYMWVWVRFLEIDKFRKHIFLAELFAAIFGY